MVAKLVEPTNNNSNIKGLLSEWGLPARPCDICHITTALFYCRADALFLCGACDAKIHVSTYHERVWICEVCEQAPATVTCKADTAVLCSPCDQEIHSANLLARRHERVPVVPFIVSATDAAIRSSTTIANSAFLIANDSVAAVPAPGTGLIGFEFEDGCDAEALLIPNPNSSFSESYLVDYDTQNQKEEFTQSVANLCFTDTGNQFFDVDFSRPVKQDNKSQQQFYSSFNYSAQNSVSSSGNGVVPKWNENSTEVSYSVCNSVTSANDGGATTAHASLTPVLTREARVLRYREKRKNRKFAKTIRYASRKAYAETRPRIKGRFVKTTGNGNEMSDVTSMFGFGFDSGSSFMLDKEYSVVPTY